MDVQLKKDKQIEERNKWFDNKLKESNLDSFTRVGDCLDKVELHHSDCDSTFEEVTRNFFRKNNKCKVCYQKNKNKEFQNMLNDKFKNQLELVSNYISLKDTVKVKHIECGRVLTYKANYYIRKKVTDLFCKCQQEKNKQELKENKTQIELNNKKFDRLLIKKKLINYKRVGNYIDSDTKLKIFHLDCQKEFEVEPKNFFRRKYKCDVCAKKYSRKEKRSEPKNDYYQNKLDELTNSEFKLMSDYYNLSSYVKLKHKVCEYEFEVRADNFIYNKTKCPKCSGRETRYNKTSKQKIIELEELLNNEYKVLNKIITPKCTVELEHKKCGTKTTCNASSIYNAKKSYGIRCEKCSREEREEEFLDKLDRVRNGSYKLRGKYRGINEETSFRHIKCGHIFRTTPFLMLKVKNDPCPKCREEKRDEYLTKKVNDFFEGEYKYIGFSKEDKKVVLEHVLCSKRIKIYQSNLLKSKNPCKECRDKINLENRKKDAQKKISEKYSNRYELIGGYINSKVDAEFYCNECKKTFYQKPSNMIFKNRRCPHCKK